MRNPKLVIDGASLTLEQLRRFERERPVVELADAARQGGLGDIAGLGGAREVLLAGQGGQILQLTNIHGARVAGKRSGCGWQHSSAPG